MILLLIHLFPMHPFPSQCNLNGFLMFSGGKKECIGNKWVIVTIIIIIIIIIITIIILLPFSVKAFVLLFIIANTKFVSIPNVWQP